MFQAWVQEGSRILIFHRLDGPMVVHFTVCRATWSVAVEPFTVIGGAIGALRPNELVANFGFAICAGVRCWAQT